MESDTCEARWKSIVRAYFLRGGRKALCSVCGARFQLESMDLCSSCGATYCYQCVWDLPELNAAIGSKKWQCGCGGETRGISDAEFRAWRGGDEIS